MRREVKYGRLLTLLTCAKRNGKKERNHVNEIYSGGLTGGVARASKLMVKQRKSVANVVVDLAGAHRAHPTKEVM